jgi:hypothetical protein
LRLACWNADGVRGRKLELEQFLSEKCVDICLLNGTHLEPGRALRFANPDSGGGTAILLHRGVDHYAVPVLCLQHLEANVTHLLLATRPVKIVAAYISPTQPLIGSNLSECQSGGFSVLMTGDVNTKQDWNSRLTTDRGALMRGYDIRNTCLICRPEFPTTSPYTQNTIPDVQDTLVVKDFDLPL